MRGESVASIQINLEDIFKTETNVETSWGRANPSSDKPKLARIELVFIFEMVLTFETSTTEGRSGGAVCVFISRLSSFLTFSLFLRVSLILRHRHTNLCVLL